MKRLDVMVDIETLGTDLNSHIIMLAWVVFDMKSHERKEYKLYIHHNNAVVNMDTLRWWLDTDAELLNNILSKGVVTEKEAIAEFVRIINLLKKDADVYLWGNGILFDNGIIKSKCTYYGIPYPIDYDKDRDVRTLLDLYTARTGMTKAQLKEMFKPSKEHDALADCIAQINMVRYMYGGIINNETD